MAKSKIRVAGLGANQDQFRAEKRRPPVVLILAVAITLLTAVAVWLLATSRANLPLVDMKDVIKGNNIPLKKDRRPALRIAIAAMISPERTRDIYSDLLHRIADLVYFRVLVTQRRTYAEVNAMVARREVDFAFVCSGSYVLGHENFGMEILAVPVVHGKTVYHSYILAHRDSGIKSPDDLKGRRFAFTDPDSHTGYWVPSIMLTRRGETPESFFSETFFTYSHDNSIRAVADGLAEGAAVDSLIWDYLNTTEQSFTSLTRIIHKSPPYGIPPIVVHPDMDRVFKARLRSIFLSLHKDEKAAPILRQLQIDRFAAGEDSMYDTVREISEAIRKRKVGRP